MANIVYIIDFDYKRQFHAREINIRNITALQQMECFSIQQIFPTY
jgi:hypothetical protein